MVLLLFVTATGSVGAQTNDEQPPSIFLTGGATIRSVPVGAEVFIDGRSVGATPLDIPEIRPGRRRLRLEYRGYRSVERWITIPAGTTIRVEETLEPELRTVVITDRAASMPIELHLNGRWTATDRVRFRPGRYDIQIRAFGYAPAAVRLDIPPASATSANDDPLTIEVALEEIAVPTIEIALIGRPAVADTPEPTISVPLSITTDAPEPITVVVQAVGAHEVFRTSFAPNARSSEVIVGPFGVPDGVDGGTPLRILAFDGHTSIDAPVFDEIVVPLTARGGAFAPIYRNGFGTPLLPTPFAEHRSRVSAVIGGGVIAHGLTGDTVLFLPGFFRVGWRPWGMGTLTAGGRVRPGSDTRDLKGDFSASLGIDGAVSRRVYLAATVGGRIDDAFSGERVSVVEGVGTGVFGFGSFDTILAAGGEHDVTGGATRPIFGAAVRYHYRDATASLSSKVFLTNRSEADLPSERVAIGIQTPIGGEVFLQGSVGMSRFPSRFDMDVELGIGYSIVAAPSISTYTR